MASRFTRSVPVTINDVLDGHVGAGPAVPGPRSTCMATWASCSALQSPGSAAYAVVLSSPPPGRTRDVFGGLC